MTFSIIAHQMEQFADAVAHAERLAPAPPFPVSQMGEKAKNKRLKKGDNFWEFDKIYFPPEIHAFYAAPCRMHRELLTFFDRNGVDVVAGPRAHAKTGYAIKMLVWRLLTGKTSVAGVYSETLPKAQNLLYLVGQIIAENPRILYDYAPTITERNYDQIEFHINGKYRTVAAFSEGRSLRGYTVQFSRPEILLVDDMETLQSSFGNDQVEHRIRKLAEAFASMAPSVGSVVVLGNNFETRSAFNRLLNEAKAGILPDKWRYHTYRAWDGTPLWREAYPAKTESELRAMLGALDEADWQGNYQQHPIPPEGILFRREHYSEWNAIPNDVRIIGYCDPNISLKSRGDTTAFVCIGHSPTSEKFYLVRAICRSFSEPNALLHHVSTEIQQLRESGLQLYSVAWDGNVTQESTWTAFVANYAKNTGIPFPRIEYKRYNVDALAKNTQLIYSSGDLLFPPKFNETDEGQRFLTQFFSFAGKSSGKHDDAPDAVICAIEYLHERRLVRRKTDRVIKTSATSLSTF